jgi:hypothetical protein
MTPVTRLCTRFCPQMTQSKYIFFQDIFFHNFQSDFEKLYDFPMSAHVSTFSHVFLSFYQAKIQCKTVCALPSPPNHVDFLEVPFKNFKDQQKKGRKNVFLCLCALKASMRFFCSSLFLSTSL